MTPQTWDCTDARLSLGVYVLGAIDPAERALVDAHLATCRDCRDELAGLAGLPALLARVNPDEISRICADDTVGADTHTGSDDRPPEELIGTVLDLAQARPPETGQAALELLPSDDDADRTLESWAVADALASLRPDHRRVIVETYYRGCSVAEAAATLGIPAGTVKSRTFYALKALKLALQERGLAP